MRIPSYVLFSLIAIGIILAHTSCSGGKNRAEKTTPVEKAVANPVPTKKNLILVKGDSLQVSINDSFITIPKKSVINYDSVYAGIYNIDKKSISQTFSKQVNGIAYFTTYDNVGMGYRGYLYAFDLKQKKFITGSPARNNYVYSSGGIFFLDRNRIFSVCKPNHQMPEDPFTTATEIYKVDNYRFLYLKYIDVKGEMTYDDTSIVKLYHIVTKH